MNRRIERLNEQVKREISDILRSEVRDPRVGPVTVTEARVAPDLSIARVYVQALGDEEQKKETLQGLKAASAHIRRELSKRLKVRTVPELRFESDNALEYGLHIEKLLSGIKSENTPESEEEE